MTTIQQMAARVGRKLARWTGVAPERRAEFESTFDDVCRGSYHRGGVLALMAAVSAEVANVATTTVARAVGRELAITGGARQAPGERKPIVLIDDVRHAWRRLVVNPKLVLGIAAMLGLGIGMATAMFTVVDALLLRPVPFKNPEQLSQIYMGTERGGRTVISVPLFRAWKSSPAFEAVEGLSTSNVLIDHEGQLAARVSAFVSPGLFDMLGARALEGRLFHDGDGRAGTDDIAVISEGLWRAVFRGDRSIIGRRVTIDKEPVLIVGVLPANVRFPSWDTQVWRPLDYFALPPARAALLPQPYVRWAQGVPRADAERIGNDTAHEVDGATAKLRIISYPLAGFRLDEYAKRAVPMLAGGVVLVCLILCANVSSLLLARLAARRREFSMCSALGASRLRLLRQSIIEQLMIGGLGALAGVGLAWALVATTRAYLPDAYLLRTLNPIDLDMRALAVGTIVALATTLLAGVVPAWLGTRVASATSMRAVERGGTESVAARRLLRSLIVGEVALACALLLGAAVLVRSFINLSQVDRGLKTDGVLVAWVTVSGPDAAARSVVAAAAGDSVRSLPGVRSVAASYGIPPGGGAFAVDDWTSDVLREPVHLMIESYEVGNDFFELYEIPLLRGRTFQPGDADEIIVGERLAGVLWPGTDPIGHTFNYFKSTLKVVGIVREIRNPSIDSRRDNPEFYRTFRPRGYFGLNIRCDSTCPDIARVRQQIVASSAAVEVSKVAPLDDAYAEQLSRPRAAAALAFAFAVIAMTAAAAGLFGVLTYAVGRRRREFGIRSALGASPGAIRTLVLRDGATVATIGIALGVGGAWLLSRALAAFEYGVGASDPLSWALVLSLLTATTMAAAWRPASTAMRVNPVTLLRDE